MWNFRLMPHRLEAMRVRQNVATFKMSEHKMNYYVRTMLGNLEDAGEFCNTSVRCIRGSDG